MITITHTKVVGTVSYADDDGWEWNVTLREYFTTTSSPSGPEVCRRWSCTMADITTGLHWGVRPLDGGFADTEEEARAKVKAALASLSA